jgi:hypothetical protein
MLVVLACAMLATLVAPSPARAGGWATTLLDPLPERIESGHTYTVGFWVLQHGSHPFEGTLGPTSLRLSDASGQSVSFSGAALPEAAHYAAAIVIAHDGQWHLTARQGLFADYEIGTLSVPGQLTVLPTPTPMSMGDEHGDHWGQIRPPLAAAMAPAGQLQASTQAAGLPAQPSAGRHTGPAIGWLPVTLIGIAAIALAGFGLTRRRSRHQPPQPAEVAAPRDRT